MKKFVLIILLVMITALGFSQKTANYTLSVNFAPSFMRGSKLVLHLKNGDASIKLSVQKGNADSVIADDQRLSALTAFLNTYQFKIKGSVDTLGSHKVFLHGDSVTVYDMQFGVDGITVGGTWNENNNMHSFAFWSPQKDSENAKFMSILFDLLESSFSKSATIDYIETLRDYFPHHLLVRQLSINPLKYKWYGAINTDQINDLDVFFNKLPKNKPIYIDVSIGTLAPIIKDYYVQNKNIYWVNPSKNTVSQLIDAGVKPKHIIFEKQ